MSIDRLIEKAERKREYQHKYWKTYVRKEKRDVPVSQLPSLIDDDGKEESYQDKADRYYFNAPTPLIRKDLDNGWYGLMKHWLSKKEWDLLNPYFGLYGHLIDTDIGKDATRILKQIVQSWEMDFFSYGWIGNTLHLSDKTVRRRVHSVKSQEHGYDEVLGIDINWTFMRFLLLWIGRNKERNCPDWEDVTANMEKLAYILRSDIAKWQEMN